MIDRLLTDPEEDFMIQLVGPVIELGAAQANDPRHQVLDGLRKSGLLDLTLSQAGCDCYGANGATARYVEVLTTA